jgi:hypothetical protein
VKFIGKVGRRKSILAAIRQHREPKLDAFRDTQPMKITQQLIEFITVPVVK